MCVSTGSICLQPLGLCTQAGLYGLCLAAPVEMTSRGVTNLVCTAGNSQVFAKEQLIAGNQFSLVSSSLMKPVTWRHCWGPNTLRDGVSPMCASIAEKWLVTDGDLGSLGGRGWKRVCACCRSDGSNHTEEPLSFQAAFPDRQEEEMVAVPESQGPL